jgi:hypothetical protein
MSIKIPGRYKKRKKRKWDGKDFFLLGCGRL